MSQHPRVEHFRLSLWGLDDSCMRLRMMALISSRFGCGNEQGTYGGAWESVAVQLDGNSAAISQLFLRASRSALYAISSGGHVVVNHGSLGGPSS